MKYTIEFIITHCMLFFQIIFQHKFIQEQTVNLNLGIERQDDPCFRSSQSDGELNTET